jgi:two-component system phosphate regulon sensor histidine kinase PhoR
MEAALVAALALVVLLSIALARTRGSLARREHELETAQRERRRELATQQEWIDALTNTTSLGLVMLNSHGRITFMNRAAHGLLAIDEGIGRPLGEIAWALDLQPSVDYVFKQRNEAVHQTIQSGERTYAATLRGFGEPGAGGVFVELDEVTELQRLGRARRDFVANISHELRTPVTSLQLLSETISENRLGDRAFAVDFLSRIRIQVDLLRQLTDELMDLALIESGQAPITLVETNAADLANQVADTLRPQAERKGLGLDVSVPSHLMVLADTPAMRKVLGNLVHNAIKFTPSGGYIQIRAISVGENVEFAVEDSGIGIPAQDLPRVFERFYKVDRSRTRANGELRGTGLGLAIAKHMVSAHGGTIWATSVEGHGSTFYFTLPAAQAPSEGIIQ